jgi:hypothetical protein
MGFKVPRLAATTCALTPTRLLADGGERSHQVLIAGQIGIMPLLRGEARDLIENSTVK